MLPRTLTLNTAAALLGRSPQAVRKLIADGVLTADQSRYWTRISLAEIERFRDSRVDAAEYMQAQASLERQRSQWRANSERRRAAEQHPAAAGHVTP